MGAITTAEIFAGLRYAEGLRWPGSSITYSLPGADALWSSSFYDPGSEPFDPRYGVLSPAQRIAFVNAVSAWERLIDVDLFEVTDSGASPGQIRVAFTDTDSQGAPDSAAYAYTPPQPGFSTGPGNGDIWIDDDYKTDNAAPGSFFFGTLLHEIGHTLGLKHPFDGTMLPAEFNNTRYSVMAYDDFEDGQYRFFNLDGGTLFANTTSVQPTTPMLLDVIAIQGIYGAATSAELGATTWTFDPGRPLLMTVVDHGGTDTFDLSTHTRASNINLTPGTYSSVALFSVQAQIAFWQDAFPNFSQSFIRDYLNKPDTYTWSNNVATAPDTVIENVMGGSAADTITGNSANNSLSGGAGGDQIFGGAGGDTIVGGSGGSSYLRGDDGNDTISGGEGFDDINGNMGADTAAGGAGDDFVVGGKDSDLLFGDGGFDLVYGNLGDDTANGGDGNDIVRGGQGNDTLSGGAGADFVSGDRDNDTMTGGAGADIFHSFSDAGMDRVLDFSVAEGDSVQLDPGTSFTLMASGADTMVVMSGGMVVLVGVSMSSLLPTSIFVG